MGFFGWLSKKDDKSANIRVIRVSKNMSQPTRSSRSQKKTTTEDAGSASIYRISKPQKKKVHATAFVLGLSLLMMVVAALIASRWYFRAPAPTNVNRSNPSAAVPQPSETDTLKKVIASKPAELREALSAYAETSPDIRQLLIQNLEEKNIGGAVTVAVANLQKNSGSGIDSPEQLGFSRIVEDKALVNRAMKGEIDITKVTVSRAGEHIFEVNVDVKNKQAFPLECVIPKGQLAEIRHVNAVQERGASNSDATIATQSLASSREVKGPKTVVPPYEPAKISYTAYCANPDLSEPYGSANLAIYALADTSYNDWHDLRELRKNKLHLAVKANDKLPALSHTFAKNKQNNKTSAFFAAKLLTPK
jgi:hypothetical protein